MTYKDKVLTDGDGKNNDPYGPLNCRTCSTLTSRATLTNHGGLCFPCFQDYLRDGPQQRREPRTSVTVRDMLTRVRGRIGNVRL